MPRPRGYTGSHFLPRAPRPRAARAVPSLLGALMRRLLLLSVLPLLALSRAAHAQHAHGGFVLVGQGGGGTELVDAGLSLDMAYTVEVGDRTGPYLGGRYVFGIHRLRADEEGFRARYGGEVEGGGGTLYDTGGDIEAGFGAGVLRVYGFTGIHYYQQFHGLATVRQADGEEVEVLRRKRETIANATGAGVQLRLTDEGALVGEWYRGGGEDGVMRLSGTRFGLRWAW